MKIQYHTKLQPNVMSTFKADDAVQGGFDPDNSEGERCALCITPSWTYHSFTRCATNISLGMLAERSAAQSSRMTCSSSGAERGSSAVMPNPRRKASW
jgi:hypothetical protein